TAGALRELGIRAGDRVAIVLPTGEDFMDAFFGALLAGAIPVPLYPPVRLGRLDEFHLRTARCLLVCGARVVLSDARVSRLLGGLLLAVYRPGPLTLLGPELFLARPALWLRAISRARATLSVAPNFAYGLCVRRIRDEELEGVDLTSWRCALNGAEPVAPAVLRRFSDRFRPHGFDSRALMPVYGLSEASL